MDKIVEVLVTIPLSEDQIKILGDVSSRLKLTILPNRDPNDIPTKVWQNTEILYTSVALPEPEQAPNLHWIQFHRAGVDAFLDAPILRKPELLATSMRGVMATKIAEYILMMMLALGEGFPALLDTQKKREWTENQIVVNSPVELRESTVGIVGYGSIGRQLAYVLQPLGATVLAIKRDLMHLEYSGCNLNASGDPQATLVRRLYPHKALATMFKDCDFVVVTLPLTKDTEQLIQKKHFAAMKPSAFFINVSRGGVVDYTALAEALREGEIAGAALDVFPQEPLPEDSQMWDMPNTIITPHISGNSSHYEERALEVFIENLKNYLNGEELCNIIDLKRGY